MQRFEKDLDNDKNKSEFGIKVYSGQDILFCIARILVGIYFTYLHKLYVPLILLLLLFICKIVTFIKIIVDDKIISKYIHDLDKHEVVIRRINSMNKRTVFYTVALPHIIQFILCFYTASLFFIYASHTECQMLMWIVGIFIVIINTILVISCLDIFANEGFTIPLTNISFDTTKNYWGEGLTIIFWAILYLICSLYFSYIFIDFIILGTFSIIAFSGMIVFIVSIIQTVKCLNLQDVYKQKYSNIKFYDYITYAEALNKCRRVYLAKQSLKILILSVSMFVFVISTSFIFCAIQRQNSLDLLTSVICISAISFTMSTFILRRMCVVPLMKGAFDEDINIKYFSEYIDVTDCNN